MLFMSSYAGAVSFLTSQPGHDPSVTQHLDHLGLTCNPRQPLFNAQFFGIGKNSPAPVAKQRETVIPAPSYNIPAVLLGEVGVLNDHLSTTACMGGDGCKSAV